MANNQKKKYRSDFAGGINSYLGVRQIKDNESPSALNCDFVGKGGVGNRSGYTEIGTLGTYTNGLGLSTLHTATVHQLIKFADDGSNCVMSHSTDGGAWTDVTGTTFTKAKTMYSCHAGYALYVGNGTDAMKHWDGTNWNTTTNGKALKFLVYYNQRIWGVDPSVPDKLWFSGQTTEAGSAVKSKLGDFTDSTANYMLFKPGGGSEIRGLARFKTSLYVFLNDSIYKLDPASAADTFTISLVTNSIGCVSHLSITQVEEDLYFAADDGVYSLGEVANYTTVRTTNKSGKVQLVIQGMTAAQKSALVGKYYNFKYHLFYPKFGSTNDSCLVYDIRYGGWMDWSNHSGIDACVYTNSTNERYLKFLTPGGKVFKMYTGSTDAGTVITSTWYSKSFDEDLIDITKVYLDHTIQLGAVNGTINISVIFNDVEYSSTSSISQTHPQGGFGRDAFGRMSFGDATNTNTTTTSYVGIPLRISTNAQRFAVQYKISTTGQWRLDGITTTYIPLDHYAFPSNYKLT